jgi:cysteine-rich repeat protein
VGAARRAGLDTSALAGFARGRHQINAGAISSLILPQQQGHARRRRDTKWWAAQPGAGKEGTMKERLMAISIVSLVAGFLALPTPTRGDCTGLAPNNECAPGGGSKSTDCQMEWRFTPMPKRYVNATPTPDIRSGRQRSQIICWEGDPRCDFDANLTNHSCTFRSEIFINNEDPNLSLCSIEASMVSFEVKNPNPRGFGLTAVELQNIATLENQINLSLGLTVIRGDQLVTLGPGNSALNVGSSPLNLIVPQRQVSVGTFKKGKARIRVQGKNVLQRSDIDSLLLLCHPSTCGDGEVEDDHETCDDGNRANGDGCNQGCQVEVVVSPTPTRTPTPAIPSATPTITPTPAPTGTATESPTPGAGPPTAFRASTLSIADPHVWAVIGQCLDLTSTVNPFLQTPLDQDQDDPPDGLLDLSILIVFRPLDQSGPGGTAEALIDADCTAPLSSTSCTAGDATVQSADYTNQTTGTCLTPIGGTTGGYTPAVNSATAPCFVTEEINVSFELSGLTIPLQGGRVAGQYVGTPATSLSQGLLFGFLDEATADLVILPSDLPAPFGGATLSSLLAGGTGNCKTAAPKGSCTAGCRDDRDTGPLGGSGWYFYLNYTGNQVSFTE